MKYGLLSLLLVSSTVLASQDPTTEQVKKTIDTQAFTTVDLAGLADATVVRGGDSFKVELEGRGQDLEVLEFERKGTALAIKLKEDARDQVKCTNEGGMLTLHKKGFWTKVSKDYQPDVSGNVDKSKLLILPPKCSDGKCTYHFSPAACVSACADQCGCTYKTVRAIIHVPAVDANTADKDLLQIKIKGICAQLEIEDTKDEAKKEPVNTSVNTTVQTSGDGAAQAAAVVMGGQGEINTAVKAISTGNGSAQAAVGIQQTVN